MNIIPLTQKQYRSLKLSQRVEILKNKLESKIEAMKKELDELETRDANEGIRHYLYVPKNYSKDVKKLGCKWDRSKKRWYINETNDNYQILIDIYNRDNFEQGILKLNCKTKQESKDEFFEMMLGPLHYYQSKLLDYHQSKFLA
jgi:hypothetical protein